MSLTLNAQIPLFGQWYKVTAVDDNGVATLTPQGQSTGALKRFTKEQAAFAKAAVNARKRDKRIKKFATRIQKTILRRLGSDSK